MKKEPTLVLGMIVKGTDREAEILDRCLGGVKNKKKQLKPHQQDIDISKTDGIAKYVDAIYITITQPNKNVEKVAEKYGAIISHYKWDNNFYKARRFNFSQIPKEFDYYIWTDSDDIWKNPQLLRNVVNQMQDQNADTLILRYLYQFDHFGECVVEHNKTRIIKNDGTITWNNSNLHEDFQTQREIIGMGNLDISVLHLIDEESMRERVDRNIIVSEQMVKEKPKDPRSYWNLGNSYKMAGKLDESINAFLTFASLSNSSEERFIAWMRMSEIYELKGDYSKAIQCGLEAVALRPWYPEPYFQLGYLYFGISEDKKAKEWLEMGLSKEPPTKTSIVWNPRDYDFNPMFALAKVYMAMFYPDLALEMLQECAKIYPKNKFIKESIKNIKPKVDELTQVEEVYKKAKKITDIKEIEKLLDSVPKKLKYHPGLVSLRNQYFTKKESSGKDVVIFCSFTENEWTSDTAKTSGVGGSEEAVIELSKRWIDAGYNVMVYANTPNADEYTIDGVIWKPFMAWNPRDKQDITVIWRHPKPLDFDINSDVVLVDIHDVIPKEEFTMDRIAKVTKFMFKSEIHRKFYPQIPDEKVEVIPHGLDIARFEKKRSKIKKNPYKILNTSSPDRGLPTILDILERVHDKLPDNLKDKLKFRWNYGFKVWDVIFADNQSMMKWKTDVINKLNRLKKKGIVEEESGDMISQDDIVDQYLESGLLLYPSEFFEIGFISGIKGALGGAIPFTTDAFAQGEFLKDGVVVKSDVTYDTWTRDIEAGKDYGVEKESQINEFVDKIVEYYKDPSKYDDMRNKIIDRVKSEFDWDKTSKSWIKIFKNG